MNVNALKAEVVKNGYTMAQVAKLIGISETTMSRRLKKQDFGLDEAERLIDVLHIQNPGEIFLPQK